MIRDMSRHCLSVVSTILMLASAASSAAQERYQYERAWAIAGPCCGDSGHDIAVEPDGSFFIVGNYGAIDLDGDGAIDQRSDGGHDAIIMKGRPSGELAWVRAPRSPAASYARLTVASDRQGGAYLVGAFIDSMQFRSGERITGRGPSHGLLVRYSAAGDLMWARAIGGDRTDFLVDAASDTAGLLYVVGTMQGAVDLDSDGRADATIRGANGLVAASYDLSGRLRWAKASGGAGDVSGSAITVSPAGEVYVAGHYKGTDVDLDADGRVDLPAAGPDGAPFLARFDAGGRLARAVALPGSGNNRIGKLALAGNGDLIASGYTQGSVDLNGDGSADVRSAQARQVPFVARFAREGALVWVRAFQQEERLAILDLTTSADRIAVSGLFERRLDLDGDGRPDAAADPDGRSEGFVALLDQGGAIAQVLAITGPGHDQPRGAALAPDGRSVSLTGFVRLTADFDGDGQPEGAIRCDNFGDLIWARYRLKP